MRDNHSDKKVLAAIGTTSRKPLALPHRFTMPVISMSDDKGSAEIKLCTGNTIHIPTHIVKNIVSMGQLTTATEHCDLIYGELDVTTDAGRLLQQTAHEIDRVSRALRRATAPAAPAGSETTFIARAEKEIVPDDTLLPAASTKWFVNGIAGTPQELVYSAPPNQFLASINIVCTGCFLENSELTGIVLSTYTFPGLAFGLSPTGIVFYVDAAHGTPYGTAYTANVTLNFQLVQETT